MFFRVNFVGYLHELFKDDPADGTVFGVKVSFTSRSAFPELGEHAPDRRDGELLISGDFFPPRSSCPLVPFFSPPSDRLRRKLGVLVGGCK